VARKKTPQKVEDIAEAAIACFTDMGIRRTQMADVAKAAGVSAGIDGALFLARLIAGEEIAKTIQLGIEYYPHPPFSYASPDDVPESIHNTIRAAEETGLLEQMETTQPCFPQPSL